MTTETVEQVISRLLHDAQVVAAIGATIAANQGETRLPAEVRDAAQAVVAAAGYTDVLAALNPTSAQVLLSTIQFTLGQTAQLATGTHDRFGWFHTDPAMLIAQGTASGAFPSVFKRVAPMLGDLAERLDRPDAAFLDVGVGIAAIAIGVANAWPNVHVTGIDIWKPSLELAAQAVDAAGLGDRITLKEVSAQQMTDRNAFDVAWFSAAFIPITDRHAALTQVLESLRPGGWVLFGLVNPGPTEETAAVANLRYALWGGTPTSPTEGEQSLRDAGYEAVRTLPAPPESLVALTVGRKPG